MIPGSRALRIGGARGPLGVDPAPVKLTRPRGENTTLRSCLVDGYSAETQRVTCTNGAQTTPVAGAEPREVMPLVGYQASVEAVLRWERSDQVVFGLRWEQREGRRSCCLQHE